MRSLLADLIVVGLALVPLRISALPAGITDGDIAAYKHFARDNAHCRAAIQIDANVNPNAIAIGDARRSLHNHALCRSWMQRQQAPRNVLHVNDFFIGMMCVVVGMADRVERYPVCNTQPY